MRIYFSRVDAKRLQVTDFSRSVGKLQMQVSSNVRGKGRLQRMSTTLHVDDPVANEAIKSAMADLSKTEGGRSAVAGLLKKHSSQVQ